MLRKFSVMLWYAHHNKPTPFLESLAVARVKSEIRHYLMQRSRDYHDRGKGNRAKRREYAIDSDPTKLVYPLYFLGSAGLPFYLTQAYKNHWRKIRGLDTP